jgi:hypothetical protein
MDTAVLLSGILLAACALAAMALSNRSKDRTIERLVLLRKSKSSREYGFARAIERTRSETVALPPPGENGGSMRREEEPIPDSETAAMFNRPG